MALGILVGDLLATNLLQQTVLESGPVSAPFNADSVDPKLVAYSVQQRWIKEAINPSRANLATSIVAISEQAGFRIIGREGLPGASSPRTVSLVGSGSARLQVIQWLGANQGFL